MKKRIIVVFFLPVLLFACTALKPVEKLNDSELADRYDKIDLQIYMVKRAASENNPANGLSSGEMKKVKKLEEKLGVVRKELVERGYMP